MNESSNAVLSAPHRLFLAISPDPVGAEGMDGPPVGDHSHNNQFDPAAAKAISMLNKKFSAFKSIKGG